MLSNTSLFLADQKTDFRSLFFWLKNLSFIFLFVGLLVLFPSPAQADTLKTLQLQWSYDTSLPGLAGYRIYHDGAFLDEVDDPTAQSVTLDVWLTDGTNNFTMTAFDVDGNESAQSAPYSIDNTLANQPPTAVIQADILSGNAPLTVAFGGTGSSDPDGSIVKYFWDTGDGASSSASSFSYTYLASGTYTVSLTVTDDQGATATSTVVVSVTDPTSSPDQAPTAVIDASVLNGVAPLSVSFDGSGSSDPDGTVASYQWDFGDGEVASGAQVSHDFANVGDYTVTLTVTDDGGKTAVATTVISVTAQLPPPVITGVQSQQLAWSYDTSQAGLAGYRIYNNGQLVTTINDPLTLTAAVGAWLVDGANSFIVTAVDVNGNESAPSDAYVMTVQTTSVNNPPVANDDGATLFEDTDVLVDVLGNDQDPDGDRLTVVSVSQASDGVVAIEANGILYTPNPGFHGKDSFTYTVSDGRGGTATAQVDLWVMRPNSHKH